ncbi:Ribokinase like superfamily protein, putative [Babesia bigemina]|uniref:Ribokinase like superfamily protein, putative n=1 Tax=Babesia bigemina TaxID=5866 RepID=A0A061D0Q1_BABBI|nr:Ribokinase like superfamily protein, putative [Babesia bigemina]CDR93717.1 Ribokinase like superfamily protein, putative [Babesia bigemina]|eukprot:XP_012765903.1 Ribokinase like superfamily protein, putative [Babesia bigemina]
MNGSYLFAAVACVFAAFVQYAKCIPGSGDEKLIEGPSRVLFVGHPTMSMHAPVVPSVIENLNIASSGIESVSAEDFRAIRDTVDVEANNPGDSSSNLARCYAALGGQAAYFGICGDDDLAQHFSDALLHYGVDDLTVRVPGLSTTQMFSLVTPDAENKTYVRVEASHTLKPEDLNESIVEDFDYYAVNGFMFADEEQVKFTHKMVDAALNRNKGLITVLGSTECVKKYGELLKPIADKSDFLAGTIEEISELYQVPDRKELFRMMTQRTTGIFPQHRGVILMMGSKGSVIFYKGMHYYVPTEAVESVDRTSANDFYAGAVLYGLLNGWDVRAASQLGLTVYGDIITHMGTLLTPRGHSKVQLVKDAA